MSDTLLAELVERVVPRRIGRGTYDVEITWTPLWQALRQLRDGEAAA